eukprot:362107-Chlamydomonas_euryale.AAC.4
MACGGDGERCPAVRGLILRRCARWPRERQRHCHCSRRRCWSAIVFARHALIGQKPCDALDRRVVKYLVRRHGAAMLGEVVQAQHV